MTRFVAYSESPRLTEESFLRNEYSVFTHFVQNPKEILRHELPANVLIASTNPFLWRETLSRLRRESVTFFLLGNETYEPSVFNSLNGIKSIKHVFIYNPPSIVERRSQFFALLGTLIDSQASSISRDLRGGLRDFRTSFHLNRKFKGTNISYSNSSFPQGYSNSFFEGLVALGLAPAPTNHISSLLTQDYYSLFVNSYPKRRAFFFLGQETNRRRAQVISLLGNFADSKAIEKKSGFGGNYFDGDLNYVSGILSNWFNVIPPGHFNNSNHRYTESTIVGTVPVILAHNGIDCSFNANWTNEYTPLISHSFRLLSREMIRMNTSELRKLADSIRHMDLQKTLRSISTFRNLMSL